MISSRRSHQIVLGFQYWSPQSPGPSSPPWSHREDPQAPPPWLPPPPGWGSGCWFAPYVSMLKKASNMSATASISQWFNWCLDTYIWDYKRYNKRQTSCSSVLRQCDHYFLHIWWMVIHRTHLNIFPRSTFHLLHLPPPKTSEGDLAATCNNHFFLIFLTTLLPNITYITPSIFINCQKEKPCTVRYKSRRSSSSSSSSENSLLTFTDLSSSFLPERISWTYFLLLFTSSTSSFSFFSLFLFCSSTGCQFSILPTLLPSPLLLLLLLLLSSINILPLSHSGSEA